MIAPEYVHFSEESNALDYLDKTVEFVRRAETNPPDWKWVMLALHGTLYGLMICALKGTDPDRVTIKARRGGDKRLISFVTALEWCQNVDRMMMNTNSKVLRLSDDQKRSLDLIQEHLRNAFVHYQPGLWSIELHGMPTAVIDGLEIVRFLTLESGNIIHLTVEDCEHIRTLVSQTSYSLRRARLFVESNA
jgi:hypothetical protein